MCASALSDIRRFLGSPTAGGGWGVRVVGGSAASWRYRATGLTAPAAQLSEAVGATASLGWSQVRCLPCCCRLFGACGLGCHGSGAKLQALPMLILQFYPFHVFHCAHLRCADVWNSLVSWYVGQRPSC